jgi:hypothetical protein
MLTSDKLEQMKRASYLLPDPGGEVARELIAEVVRLRVLRAEEEKTTSALEALTHHLQSDPDLARGWHDNVAMAVDDAIGVGHAHRNAAASMVMERLFKVATGGIGVARDEPPMAVEALREALADLCHEQWSGWMRYLFSKCEEIPHLGVPDRSTKIPDWAVQRWTRQ